MSYAFEMLPAINYFATRELTIFVSEDCVELILRFENHLNKATISYKNKEDDTLIEVTEYNKMLVKDKNYIDMACEDFFHISAEARFAEDLKIWIIYGICDEYEEIEEAVNRFYEQFKIYSQTTKNGINVQSLQFEFENLSQLRSVLTYFNPTNLEELIIFSFEPTEDVFDFRSIVKMDHWKNAKKIKLYDFFVNIPFEDLSHCEDVTINVSNISADDIQTLVNIGSNSPSFKYFCFEYGCLNEHVTEQFLDSLIGEKHVNTNGEHVRFIQYVIIFVHDPDRKRIYMHKFSDENDESVETSKALTSQPSKSATLCLSNRLIMEKIVQHFDFAELVVLRRVFSESRRCVDLLKPDPKLVAVKITVEPGFICVEVFGRNNNRTIIYEAPGTDIPATSSTLHINHKADINNLSDDLVQLFKDQKTVLKELCVILHPSHIWMSDVMGNIYRTLTEEQFVDIFKKAHSLRGSVFLVEKLNLTATRLTRATKILENLDPVAIKIIELRTMNFGYDVQLFLNDIASLEQWKNAEELKIRSSKVECDLEKLVHFSKVDIRLKSISIGDVLYLKEKFLSSSNFRQFKTNFLETDVDVSIFEDNFLGAPFRRVDDISSGQPNIWFFPYTDVMDDLQIRYYQKRKVFMFIRVSRR